MSFPSYTTRVDWSGDGDFLDANEVLPGADVREMTIQRGLAQDIGGISMGTAGLILNNADAKYSPDKSTSPLTGLMKPFRKAEIEVIHDAVTKKLFTGFVLSYEPTNDPGPGPEDRRVTRVQLADRFRLLQHARTTTAVLANKKLHEIVETILTDVGIGAADRTIETTFDTSPFALFTNEEAILALEQVVEAGFYRHLMGVDGKYNLWNRYHGLGVASYKTYAAEMVDFLPVYDEEEIKNLIQVKSEPRKKDASLAVVARLQVPYVLTAGQSVTLWLDYFDPSQTSFVRAPADEMVTPVASTDYTAGSTETGTDKTAQLGVTVTFFAETAKVVLTNNDSAKIFVSKFEPRGKPLRPQTPILREAEDASSQTTYQKRRQLIENNLIGSDLYAKDYAEFLLLANKDVVPRGTMRLHDVWPDLMDLDLGTIITINDTHTGVNYRWYIEGIGHRITQQGFRHEATYRLRKHVDYDWLILDKDPEGRLDQRRLAF